VLILNEIGEEWVFRTERNRSVSWQRGHLRRQHRI